MITGVTILRKAPEVAHTISISIGFEIACLPLNNVNHTIVSVGFHNQIIVLAPARNRGRVMARNRLRAAAEDPVLYL